MKAIRVTNETSIKCRKPILLTAASRGDQFFHAGQWRDTDAWQHGEAVETVRHFRQHSFTVGDVLALKAISGEVLAYAEITGITMIAPARLADPDDFRALGYASRQAYLADWGEVMGDRVWIYRIRYVEEV